MGVLPVIIHLDGDFPWNQPFHFWGTPMTSWTPHVVRTVRSMRPLAAMLQGWCLMKRCWSWWSCTTAGETILLGPGLQGSKAKELSSAVICIITIILHLHFLVWFSGFPRNFQRVQSTSLLFPKQNQGFPMKSTQSHLFSITFTGFSGIFHQVQGISTQKKILIGFSNGPPGWAMPRVLWPASRTTSCCGFPAWSGGTPPWRTSVAAWSTWLAGGRMEILRDTKGKMGI